jgi:putative Ca2+/H+ antiporter (TMEM165/GDT1 family)
MNLDPKLLGTVFSTVFMMELGDKTQLSTILFSSGAAGQRWQVFFASAAALVVASAIGVLAGSVITKFINPKILNYLAGAAFIGLGIWTILKAG